MISATPHHWEKRDLVVVAVAVVILVLFRLHAFAAPLETDECNYAYFGEQLLAGERLYVDLWDHQPPGMFMLTVGLVAAFGPGPLTFRIAATIAAVLILILVYATCRGRMSRGACWLAAGLFAIASSDPGVAGEGCNREVYMNLLGVGGLYLALTGRWWGLLGAGLCLGFSSLLKTVVAAQWFVMAAAIIAWSVPKSPGLALRRLFWFAIGPIGVWAATFLYFHLTDRLSLFIDAAFIYNLDYGKIDTPLWSKFAAFFNAWTVFRSGFPLWLMGGVGLFLLPWKKDKPFALLVAGYAVGSFVAVCLPGRFWHHYYMLMLPCLIIGSAALLDRCSQRMASRGKSITLACASIQALLLLAFQFVCYLAPEPDEIALHRYGDRMAWARDHGANVRSVTHPDDFIYVCGIDTGIYYYSQRRCATRYTLATVLIGDDEAAMRRRQNFLEDLRAHQPRLILVVRGLPYIPELDRFIREAGYVKIGEDPGRMDVLCAASQPVESIKWFAGSPPF